jgi:hypothetical protein
MGADGKARRGGWEIEKWKGKRTQGERNAEEKEAGVVE